MQAYGLKPVTPPADEPVTLADAKIHLRQDITDDDSYITSLIKAARRKCESCASRILVTSTWDMVLDGFPGSAPQAQAGQIPYALNMPQILGSSAIGQFAWPIRFPILPIQSIVSISYYDPSATLQSLSPANYVFTDYGPNITALLTMVQGQFWPTTLRQPGAVKVRFIAGYGVGASVPETYQQAIKMLVGMWYVNREPVNVGNIVSQIPWTVQCLLDAESWGSY